ncbi:thymus-specific serine protease-like isoform X1 [Montipora foliosa]|uniref:thymus-specific serine protease-like isoform X1 n=1 Tax=Montipora foliosa TaxID=591990 RepID=UPI0035F1AEE8
MNKQELNFDGFDIYGHKLNVCFKGDGVLSSSFMIKRSRRFSWSFVFLAFFVFSVAVALCKEVLSLTVTSCFIWTVVLLMLVCIKLFYIIVDKESVLIVKDLGVQFTRSGRFGKETKQFIEQERIVDVIINEVITMHQVVFYLMLLITDDTEDNTKEKQKLFPLFTSSMPCLETIKPIYRGHIVDMAEEYGGLIFGVEHRFYGLSTFESCLDNYNLTFLSSSQALADLAAFVVFARDSYGMTDKNKWIAYGGSYPGSLAAWFKLKYPNLVSGAVASSAPVEAKTDFKEYNNVVASSFTSALVGGSEKCRDNIKNAFDEVDQLIAEKEFTTLERDFLSCKNLSSTNDTWLFSLNLANIFDSIVQYNEEGGGFSIASVCRYMTPAHLTPYENLVQFVQTFFPSTGLPCMNNNYASFLSSLKKTKRDPTGQSWDRQWTYQTCSEFGYYQTCDKNTSCLFSNRSADLSHFLGICSDIFGIPPKQVFENVAFTNYNYGGDKPKGSKTVFVNGSIDPWHALSVLSNQTSSQVAIFIPGTAHCANMNSDSPDDPPALRQARQEVSRLVGMWL